MKSATLRSFIAVHTWVGLIAGFVLFIAFYAGAITVFNKQLHVWETRSATKETPQSLAQAQPLIDAVLAAHPPAKEGFFLKLPSEYESRLELDWDERKPDGGEIEHHFRLAPDGSLLDVKPVSALSHFLVRLHYTAGLPVQLGTYVLGLVCVLYGLALVSGVVIYAPGFFKDLFALRIGRNLKRLWQDAHNAIGILSLPFHIMFAWSSAILTLGLLLMAPFQFLVFDGKLLNLVQPDIFISKPVAAAGIQAPIVPVQDLIEIAVRQVPGMQMTYLRYKHAGDVHGLVELYGDVAQHTLTGTAAVVLGSSDGKLERVLSPSSFSPGTMFLRGLTSLHYGDFGHAAVLWMYFVLGMAGAFLFYSGNLLWIESRRKHRLREQPRNTRWMAQGTLGVCLGCVAGIAALFLVNKLLPAGPDGLAVWEERTYYAVFFAAIAWAFMRPPARAAHELLMLCSVLSLLLPFAQWHAGGVNPLLSAWRGETVIVVVDLMALLFAWIYWCMARAVLRRGLHGDPHSVWSLQALPS